VQKKKRSACAVKKEKTLQIRKGDIDLRWKEKTGECQTKAAKKKRKSPMPDHLIEEAPTVGQKRPSHQIDKRKGGSKRRAFHPKETSSRERNPDRLTEKRGEK